jgi:hypothetical protein
MSTHLLRLGSAHNTSENRPRQNSYLGNMEPGRNSHLNAVSRASQFSLVQEDIRGIAVESESCRTV